MRILFKPIYIASTCLSLVSGAQFLDGTGEDDPVGVMSKHDAPDEGMCGRTDSAGYYVDVEFPIRIVAIN